MAQLVISAAGAGVGFLLGGPTGAQIGWVAGSAIGSALFPTKAPSGPRLSDLKVSGSAYGAPIPYVEGHPRVAGQVIWASDKYAVTTESGGKGGPNVETTSTIYKVDLLLLLSSNEIAGVRRVWSNGALVWTAADDATGESLIASDATEHWDALTVYGGSASQLPDPIYEAAVGSGNAPAYRGRGTVMIEALNLGSSGILPNLTFEVVQASTEGIYSTAILYAPLLNDDDDVIAPAAAVTLWGASGISYDGTQVTLDAYAAGENVTILYSAAKLYISANPGEKITMSVRAGIVSSGGDSTSGQRFFYYNAVKEPGFFTDKNAGVVRLWTWAYGIGPNEYVGPMPADAVYSIEFDPDGLTFRWYVDGVLVRTATGSHIDGNPIIQCINSSGNAVRAMAFSELQFYVGDEPFTATTYTADDAPLDDVVERLCVRAGLTTGQVDVTALAGQSVRSLAVAQVTPTRSVLEVLAGAYQFEAVESLGKIKFVSRGGSSAATIAYASMGAGREGATAEPLPLTMLNDVETPAQVMVRYVNASNDYQDGAESSDRLLGPGIGVAVFEVPVGLTPAEARTLADVQVMDVAASQRKFGPVSLSNDYAHLEPTDVVTLTDTDASTYRGRILTMRSGGGVHTIEGVIEDASILTSTIATDTDYDESADVAGAVETVMELLDIPLLRDDDDGPGFYAAFKGADTPWPGCVLFGSADGVTYTQIGSAIAEATQIGECTTTLGDWTGGTVFDEKNSVTVDVGAQTLASWSRDEILAGTATGYVIGSELLYARTATYVSAGVYTLTGLLRGRRGTEWAIAGHGATERFAALPASGRGLRRVEISTTDIGVTRYYKAVTAGRALSTATAQTLACTGVSQLPFSPVDLRAERTADHDIELTWKRRTRYATGFAGAGGIVVPLGETSEAYEVEILTAPSGSIMREIAATAAECTYTATEQAEDWAVLPTSLDVVVRQVSPAVGGGYELAATVAIADIAEAGGPMAAWGTRPVLEIGGSLFAASGLVALSSADDGETYDVERDDGSTVQVYGVGSRYFDAVLGTQRICIGINETANFGGLIVGTSVLADAPTEYRNTVGQTWYTYGYPRVSGAVIATGALYSDGTYYYIVGRLADQSQTAGHMYLYRADSSLAWALRGQIEQDGADPNELPSTGYGAFRSYWFTPNGQYASIYNVDSKLLQFGGRWFLISSSAVYYCDDADGLIGWLRCPTDLGEGDNNPPTVLAGLVEVSSTLLVARDVAAGPCLSISTDNGETWATSRPLPQYADAVSIVAFGTAALIYYRYNGVQRVAAATTPFSSWTLSEVDGVAPGSLLGDFVVAGANLVAQSDYQLLYSADGVTFTPAAPV